MRAYLDLLRHVHDHGRFKSDRTGTGTYSVFGAQVRYDLTAGFPLLTTKKLHTKSIIYELLWFLQGSTNIKYLNDHGVTIWNEWADENGELGPVYGKQWLSWQTQDGRVIDQIFIMPIEAIFMKSGRGTIVTGSIEQGIVKANEEVDLVGYSKENKKVVCVEIEMFRSLKNKAEAGQNVGILLKGAKREEVIKGHLLCKKNTIYSHSKFKAKISWKGNTGIEGKYLYILFLKINN